MIEVMIERHVNDIPIYKFEGENPCIGYGQK